MPKLTERQKIVTLDADNLAKSAARAAASGGLPPVERWNPPFCGDIDMRIARDGTWFYQGTPIGRERMVRLFSTILKREGEAYFLVTPVEKVGIKVEDVPFIAVDFRLEPAGSGAVSEAAPTAEGAAGAVASQAAGGVAAAEDAAGQRLVFVTNVGDEAVAGPAHPLRLAFDPDTGEPSPYILIRRNLEARIDRKSFYRLVELGEEVEQDGESWFGIRSSGEFFPICPASALA